MDELTQAKFRISTVENDLLQCIASATEKNPKITAEEVGVAMLNILKYLSEQEIEKYCEQPVK